jgi:hypothetical protein
MKLNSLLYFQNTWNISKMLELAICHSDDNVSDLLFRRLFDKSWFSSVVSEYWDFQKFRTKSVGLSFNFSSSSVTVMSAYHDGIIRLFSSSMLCHDIFRLFK